MELKGRIHSIETGGTVDGPGIRYVLFMQGCLLKCKYCHNRDTWDLEGGSEVSVEEIMKEVKSYKHFMRASGGGITASGGEAILQPEFVAELFKECKKENINTCLDTNGFVRKYTPIIDELLDNTDLVMLDIKQMNDKMHRWLIGTSNQPILEFAKYLEKRKQKTWIRYVVVPQYSDNREDIKKLCEFIAPMQNVEMVDVLPYHKLGMHKWETLGEKYELADTPIPKKEDILEIKELIKSYGKKVR